MEHRASAPAALALLVHHSNIFRNLFSACMHSPLIEVPRPLKATPAALASSTNSPKG
jgi:hypothetical protein